MFKPGKIFIISALLIGLFWPSSSQAQLTGKTCRTDNDCSLGQKCENFSCVNRPYIDPTPITTRTEPNPASNLRYCFYQPTDQNRGPSWLGLYLRITNGSPRNVVATPECYPFSPEGLKQCQAAAKSSGVSGCTPLSMARAAALLPEAEEPEVYCDWGHLENCLKVGTVAVSGFILWLMSWFLWGANQLFNMSLQIGILDFHQYVSGSEAINTIWGIGRDLANIFFIFILMYIAISTIIESKGPGWNRLVIELIITALLINFSIILPKVVIDVSNSLANIFYQKMGEPGLNNAPDVAGTLTRGSQIGRIAAGNVGQPSAAPRKVVPGEMTWSTIVLSNLGKGVLIIILVYALLVATYLFLARTVVLIIVIATSSLAFFSRLIPQQLGRLNYWNRWMDALIKEAFYAPIFLFMFYLVLMLASHPIPELGGSGAAPASNNGSAILLTAQAVGGGASSTATVWGLDIIWYLVIVGLAIGSIYVARSMSSWSAFTTKQIMNRGGGWIARNTIGRGASRIAGSEAMTKLRSNRFVGAYLGSAVKGGFDTVANAKFGGAKGFESARKDRATELKRRMDGMSNEQKASFMASLTSKDRGTLYRHGLSDEERTKVEGGAAANAKEGAEKAGREAYDQELARTGNTTAAERAKKEAETAYTSRQTSYISRQRANLGGEEKIKTYTQRIKGAKSADEKIKLLNELSANEKDYKAVVKGLDEQSLAKIKVNPNFSGTGPGSLDVGIKAAINDKIAEADPEVSEKYDKAEKAEREKQAKIEKKDNVEIFKSLLISGAPPAGATLPAGVTDAVSMLNILDKQDIKFFDETTAKTVAQRLPLLRIIGRKMGLPGIVQLMNHPGLTDDEAEEIGNKCKTFTGTGDQKLDNIGRAMNAPGWLGDKILKRGT
jgi:hypothetical protein